MTASTSSGTRTPELRGARTPELDDPIKSGRRWATHVEEAWDPCILALDGGGIRGYSSLLILKALMHEIYLWEQRLDTTEPLDDEKFKNEGDLLPCHYFDFMYGTSTGGLIAVMLGRLRMTIDECLETYRLVGDKLFGHRRSVVPLTTKYRHGPLEEAVQNIVGQRCYEHEGCHGRDDLHPWEVPHAAVFDPEAPRVCHSCCLTATHNKSVITAYLLRSYPHYYNENTPNWITPYNQGADPLAIWQVTRATSAAPFYFELLQAVVDGDIKIFKDGGIKENNPSGASFNEFVSIYEDKKENPALLLSVGTGRADQSQDGFAAAWPGPWGHIPLVKKLFSKLEKFSVLPSLLIKYTESEKQHQTMVGFARGEHTWYKRLNVDKGLESMPLDHWVKGPYKSPGDASAETRAGGETLNKMEAATATYLGRGYDPDMDTYAPPATILAQAAEKLVRQRRARARQGGVRWTTFIQERP